MCFEQNKNVGNLSKVRNFTPVEPLNANDVLPLIKDFLVLFELRLPLIPFSSRASITIHFNPKFILQLHILCRQTILD